MVRARTLRVVVGGLFIVLLASAHSRGASAQVTVTFSVHADVPVRLQVASSPSGTTPCDSSENKMLYDGMIGPDAPVTVDVGADAMCVRHTFDDFPDSNWGPSSLWYRRPTTTRLEAHVTRQ